MVFLTGDLFLVGDLLLVFLTGDFFLRFALLPPAFLLLLVLLLMFCLTGDFFLVGEFFLTGDFFRLPPFPLLPSLATPPGPGCGGGLFFFLIGGLFAVAVVASGFTVFGGGAGFVIGNGT